MKARNLKKGTPHQKNHRWESFTVKISKLNSLDPIRKVRRYDIDAEDLSASTSYFRSGLEKWQELNISGEFVAFCQEVLPMSDSLPQILHFEDDIVSLLFAYIEKREPECLQPLLELLADFAHDLGTRFERHYGRSLELIASIAGSQQDVEVIEWSFTCLTFMFKYLSKLLVPDLRPTYNLMASLLGKQRQQPHIARFAAEAMSFLVKKAGAPTHREQSLSLIAQYAKSDLQSISGTKEFELYFHGLMTMFSEAIKGNGLTVHTSGPAIFKSLILLVTEEDVISPANSQWVDFICGVLTSILHHTDSDTFKDVLEVILKYSAATSDLTAAPSRDIKLGQPFLSARMLGTIAGVRKGSRVSDWSSLLKSMSEILLTVSTNEHKVQGQELDLALWKLVIMSAAIILLYSPMDAAIPFIPEFMDALTKDPLAKWFLAFCSYFSFVDPGRFNSVVLAYFQRHVAFILQRCEILTITTDSLWHIGQMQIMEILYAFYYQGWHHPEYLQATIEMLALPYLNLGKIKSLANLNALKSSHFRSRLQSQPMTEVQRHGMIVACQNIMLFSKSCSALLSTRRQTVEFRKYFFANSNLPYDHLRLLLRKRRILLLVGGLVPFPE